MLGPIYLVIPGIVAYHLYSGTGIGADLAYGKLVFDVLPAPLTGFFAAVVVGLLNRRVPAVAGRVGLIVGVVVIALGYFLPGFASLLSAAGIHEFHFLGMGFAFIVALMLVIGKVKPREEPWQMINTNEVDLTPWKGAKWASLILVVLVIAIYAVFAF